MFLVLGIQSEPEMNIFVLAEFTFFWGEGNNKQKMNKMFGMSDASLCYGEGKSRGRGGSRLEGVQASLSGACYEGRMSLLASAGARRIQSRKSGPQITQPIATPYLKPSSTP